MTQLMSCYNTLFVIADFAHGGGVVKNGGSIILPPPSAIGVDTQITPPAHPCPCVIGTLAITDRDVVGTATRALELRLFGVGVVPSFPPLVSCGLICRGHVVEVIVSDSLKIVELPT